MRRKHKEKYRLMGELVEVTKTLKRNADYKGKKITWEIETLDTSRVGWVIGFTHKYEGKYYPGNTCYNGEYEQGYIMPDKTIHCLLVVFWPTYKPVLVPLDGFNEDTQAEPTPSVPSEEYTKDLRQYLRDTVYSFPRDKKGRFATYGVKDLKNIM